MTVGRVDYSLARRSVLRAIASGRTSRYEACDAHPDLLRAARYCGEPLHEACPICSADGLVTVSYVFSDEFSKRENGKVWTADVGPLMKLDEARLYTVEVCPGCSWNHLRSQLTLGKGDGALRGRRASK